jgi:hypothetical protein
MPILQTQGLGHARMSWRYTAWAKSTRGHRSPGQKLVLMTLCDYASPDDGQCWPSQQLLAEDCEMPLRTLRHHLQHLEAEGFVRTLQKGNQYQRSVYQIVTTQLGASAVANIATANAPIEVQWQYDAVQWQDDASEVAISEPPNRQEPSSLEPPVILMGEEATVDPALEKECNDAWGHVPWVEIFLADGRFPAPSDQWVAAIEGEYKDQNLQLAAIDCYRWLQTSVKGQKYKTFEKTFGVWLQNLRKDQKVTSNNNGHRSTRVEARTDFADGVW